MRCNLIWLVSISGALGWDCSEKNENLPDLSDLSGDWPFIYENQEYILNLCASSSSKCPSERVLNCKISPKRTIYVV